MESYRNYLKERHDSTCRSYMMQGYFMRYSLELHGKFIAGLQNYNTNFLIVRTYAGHQEIVKNGVQVADEPLKMPKGCHVCQPGNVKNQRQ